MVFSIFPLASGIAATAFFFWKRQARERLGAEASKGVATETGETGDVTKIDIQSIQ